MRKKENQITLDFASNLKFTEFCALTLSYIKNFLKIDEDDAFKIEIALREVVNNAILHGNKSDPQKRVFVEFKWSKNRLYIMIQDQNEDLVDFDTINKKIQSNDILSFSGRGILIMKSYMDKVEFLPSSNGTQIIMEKRIWQISILSCKVIPLHFLEVLRSLCAIFVYVQFALSA